MINHILLKRLGNPIKKMTHDLKRHRRRSIRLKDYDYSQSGAYFITISTYNKECLFGEIVDSQTHLNKFGWVISEEWLRSIKLRQEIELDEFVIMPNHIHGIVIIIESNVGATGRSPLLKGPKPKSIGAFVAGFKSAVTKRINSIRGTPGMPVWQRNYYEHIIRNERDLDEIRQYIINNPLKWELDTENPKNIKT